MGGGWGRCSPTLHQQRAPFKSQALRAAGRWKWVSPFDPGGSHRVSLSQRLCCICFLWRLESHLEPGCIHGLTRLYFKHFSLTLLKLKAKCGVVGGGGGTWIVETYPNPPPLPPQVSDTQRSEGSLLSRSDSSAVTPHGNCVSQSVTSFYYVHICNQNTWVLFVQISVIPCPAGLCARVCLSACGVCVHVQ